MEVQLTNLEGLRQSIGNLIAIAGVALLFTMFFMTLLLLLRVLTRRDWLAFILAITLTAVASGGVAGANPYAALALLLIAGVLRLIVIFRVGLLACVVTSFTFAMLDAYPLTFDLSAWYSGNTVIALLVIAGLAAYGLRVSLAGQPVFRDTMLEG